MKCNLALWDRSLRFAFGVLLVAWAIAGGPGWAYFGIYLLASSGWGYCAFYTFWGTKTLKTENPVPRTPPTYNQDFSG